MPKFPSSGVQDIAGRPQH